MKVLHPSHTSEPTESGLELVLRRIQRLSRDIEKLAAKLVPHRSLDWEAQLLGCACCWLYLQFVIVERSAAELERLGQLECVLEMH